MGRCSRKCKNKEISCYLSNKNPFNVGITKINKNGDKVILLSGNITGTSDIDNDNLPDWLSIRQRPYKEVKTHPTKDIVNLWHLDKRISNDVTHFPYNQVKPNGLLTYQSIKSEYKTVVVKVLEVNVDNSRNDSVLVVRVKELEGEIDSTLYKVSLVLDNISEKLLSKDTKNKIYDDNAVRELNWWDSNYNNPELMEVDFVSIDQDYGGNRGCSSCQEGKEKMSIERKTRKLINSANKIDDVLEAIIDDKSGPTDNFKELETKIKDLIDDFDNDIELPTNEKKS